MKKYVGPLERKLNKQYKGPKNNDHSNKYR